MSELMKIRAIINLICKEYGIPYELVAPVIEMIIQANPQKAYLLYKQIEQIVKAV
ncbi:MAG: hypothetical protein QXG39_09825 [Candidatus Aenigmatarchaeota archaeon]